jgi:DNA-binding LacI/PurR family transcriptional regulator
MVAERQFPAVAIADAHPELPSITADDAYGSKLIARRLAARGYKRVLYRLAVEGRWSSDQRYHSFLSEAVKLGMQVTTGVAVDYTGKVSDQEIQFITGPADHRPNAIVTWCDNYAMAAHAFLTECNIPIGTPEGVAIIGFDGFAIPGVPVRLTSVQIEWDKVAVMAVDVLLKVIAGESVPKLTTVPVKLMEGETG